MEKKSDKADREQQKIRNHKKTQSRMEYEVRRRKTEVTRYNIHT